MSDLWGEIEFSEKMLESRPKYALVKLYRLWRLTTRKQEMLAHLKVGFFKKKIRATGRVKRNVGFHIILGT